MLNVSILVYSAASIVCLLIYWRALSLGTRYKDDAGYRTFGMIFCCLAIYFFLLFAALIATDDLRTMGYFAAAGRPFIYAAAAHIFVFILGVWHYRNHRKTIIFGAFSFGLLLSVANIARLEPNVVDHFGKFIIILSDPPVLVRLFDGIITISSALLASYTFFLQSEFTQDPPLRRRALVIASGFFIFSFAPIIAFVLPGVIGFFLGTAWSMPFLVFLGSVAVLPALLFILAGTFIPHEKLIPSHDPAPVA